MGFDVWWDVFFLFKLVREREKKYMHTQSIDMFFIPDVLGDFLGIYFLFWSGQRELLLFSGVLAAGCFADGRRKNFLMDGSSVWRCLFFFERRCS